MRKLLIFAALTAGILAVPRVASGQSCGPMSVCSGGHFLSCPAGFGYDNCHFYCATCVFGTCHSGCDASFADAAEKKQYARVLDLADALDIEGLIAAARSMRGYVFFSPERDAVQVVACDGRSIVGNLPVTSMKERFLAAAELPRAGELNGPLGPSWRLALGEVSARPRGSNGWR